MTEINDGDLTDDPTYRAGKLMGRRQCVTEVMQLVGAKAGTNATDTLRSILEWCVQSQEEGSAELEMVVAAFRDRES